MSETSALAAPTALSLFALIACTGANLDTASTHVDAGCSLIKLAAHTPNLHSTSLNDSAVQALGDRALAGITESCDAIDPWTRDQLNGWWAALTPTHGIVLNFAPPPTAVLEQTRRSCDGDYEQVRYASHLPMREAGYVIFDACKLDRRKILKPSDLNYVRPPPLGVWRIHQMLLESGIPSALANHYTTALLLALEVDDRARGAVLINDGEIEIMSMYHESMIVELDGDGRLRDDEYWMNLDDKLRLNSGCVGGQVSIGATAPIRNLRWLLDAASEHEHCKNETLRLAVFEREQLFRPLRAEIHIPAPGADQQADLEVTVDSTGAWRTGDGREKGSDAAALTATLDRRKPNSLRVRTNGSIAASTVVDLLRVPDVWSARARLKLDVWLLIEDDTEE
jgi:hypothetical protein